MMSLNPTAAATDDALALLRVVADPPKAQELLEQIRQGLATLAERQAEITRLAGELRNLESATQHRETQVAEREEAADAREAALNERDRIIAGREQRMESFRSEVRAAGLA